MAATAWRTADITSRRDTGVYNLYLKLKTAYIVVGFFFFSGLEAILFYFFKGGKYFSRANAFKIWLEVTPLCPKLHRAHQWTQQYHHCQQQQSNRRKFRGCFHGGFQGEPAGPGALRGGGGGEGGRREEISWKSGEEVLPPSWLGHLGGSGLPEREEKAWRGALEDQGWLGRDKRVWFSESGRSLIW